MAPGQRPGSLPVGGGAGPCRIARLCTETRRADRINPVANPVIAREHGSLTGVIATLSR
jgi:hypothetical protein